LLLKEACCGRRAFLGICRKEQYSLLKRPINGKSARLEGTGILELEEVEGRAWELEYPTV
jgi:hypothetical protein